MTPRTAKAHRQRGFALLWAMFLVILVGSLGAVVLERDVTVRRDGARDLEALRSYHAAEAGIDRARHALAKGDRASGDAAFEVGPCRVTVRVTPRAAIGWDVVSEAKPGGARVEARILDREGYPVTRWHQTR